LLYAIPADCAVAIQLGFLAARATHRKDRCRNGKAAIVSPRISWVASATETETRKLPVATVLSAIRTGGKNLKWQVTQIRNRFESEFDITGDLQKAKDAVEELKKSLPGVTWSGRFSYRASDKLLKHSGLLCADLDSLGAELVEVRKKLEASPHAAVVFLSPQACAKNVDNSPLVCSAQKSGERESRALLCFIAQKLTEIEAQLHSPLAVRQLHLRYCARCGERVTNQNVGGYEGRSALTGRLFCLACADDLEDPQ
jgi:hypothetical protein